MEQREGRGEPREPGERAERGTERVTERADRPREQGRAGRMRILVTNDDGYRAEGLRTLAEAARPLGEVSVVAPDREQSGTSHSLTLNNPLRVSAREGVQAVDGTPTDCVIIALGMLLEERPGVVLSGINHGPNLGDDVLYSGTVAAAMEATILGVPAIALSLATYDEPERRLPAWGPVVGRLLERLLRAEIPPETVLNVNLPPVDPGEIRGVRLTTLGRREYVNSLARAQDPSGREFFWIDGGQSRWWGGADSDFRAIHDGYISVTPLHLDLTNYKLLEDMSRWDLSL